MNRTRILALALAAALSCALLSGCGPKPAEETAPPAAEPTASVEPAPSPEPTNAPEPSPAPNGDMVTVNLAMLKGPTGVGAAKLLYDNELSSDALVYNVTLASDPANEVVPKLVNGELDIAAISTNLAASLYQKTDGGIRVIALNTLGVLYLLENGNSIQSMADLAGKTVYATGQGSNPEYVLNYLLEQNGLTPGEDVTIEWRAADEITALMASGEAEVCMLPVPAATAVQMKNPEVRAALDLTEVWNSSVTNGSVLTMGCVVARTDFLEEHPDLVSAFLEEYEASVSYVKENPEEAAPMVAQFEITANEQIALRAIPDCNLVCITGGDIQPALQDYLSMLYTADPASIGGAIPDDAFYYVG